MMCKTRLQMEINKDIFLLLFLGFWSTPAQFYAWQVSNVNVVPTISRRILLCVRTFSSPPEKTQLLWSHSLLGMVWGNWEVMPEGVSACMLLSGFSIQSFISQFYNSIYQCSVVYCKSPVWYLSYSLKISCLFSFKAENSCAQKCCFRSSWLMKNPEALVHPNKDLMCC